MTLTMTTLTGPVYLPNGATPLGGRVSFELSSWDVESLEGLVVSGPVYSNIDVNGQFSVNLFTTSAGNNSVTYRMFVIWEDSTLSESYVNGIYVGYPTPHYTKKYIGSFALSGSGPFKLSELTIISELENSSFDAYLEMKAYADRIDLGELDAAVTLAVSASDEAKDYRDQSLLNQTAAKDAQDKAELAETASNAAQDKAEEAANRAEMAAAEAGVDIGRAEMVAMILGGTVPQDGARYSLDGWSYIGATGATALPGLPGMLPLHPVTPFHFGAIGNGVADDRAAFAAMNAYGGEVYIPKPQVAYKFSATVTLTCPVAVSPGAEWNALTDNGKLQFVYQQFRDSSFVQINRFPGRTFFGSEADHSGNRRGVNGYGTDYISQGITSWIIKAATVAACSEDPQGRIGLLGAAWCKEGENAAICTGVAGIARNQGYEGTARGGFFEIMSEKSAGYETAADAGIELQVGNRSTFVPTVSPYSMSNSIVNGLQLSPIGQPNYLVGDADIPIGVAANPAGAALLMNGKGTYSQVWTAGMVCTDDALSLDGGGFGNALLLAQKHKIRWDAKEYNEGAAIWSQVTNTNQKVGIAFLNNRVSFLGSGGEINAVVDSTAGAVNYLSLTGSATGAPCAMRAFGTDTDISLKLTPKGAGYVQFGTFTSVGSGTINGYITIKDATGAVRKLATIA